MERIYFNINESGAKTAHNMMSFSDYKEGSRTAGYKVLVDKAYELGENVSLKKKGLRTSVRDIHDGWHRISTGIFR